MAVAANICVAWPSTVGSIPAGWSRETTLDAHYILGAATGADTDLVTDRGATTHTHTSPSHTPVQNAHTHDFSTGDGTADNALVGGSIGQFASDIGHGHNSATSNATTAVNNGVAITVNAASNDLAFLEVIWIKSDGTPASLPSGCLAFFASDSLPSGWSRVQADRYLKGAGSGADGGTTGGANTHTHTSPAHTHTQVSHQHTGTSGSSDIATPKGTGTETVASLGHTHSLTFDAIAATNQPVTTTFSTDDGEPPFTKLNTVQAASASLPNGIIALWLGTNATIPANWTRYTTMDGRFLRGAAVDGESGIATGGSSTHTHTASDCQPTQDAHTHTVTDPGSVGTITANSGGVLSTFAGPGHHHFPWDVTSTVATNNAVSVTIDPNSANSAFPKHRTVIYVQFTGSAPVRPPSTYTSYDLNIFNIGDPYTGMLPEAAHRFAAGDLRHVPR